MVKDKSGCTLAAHQLNASLIWDETTEGDAFWRYVYHRLMMYGGDDIYRDEAMPAFIDLILGTPKARRRHQHREKKPRCQSRWRLVMIRIVRNNGDLANCIMSIAWGAAGETGEKAASFFDVYQWLSERGSENHMRSDSFGEADTYNLFYNLEQE